VSPPIEARRRWLKRVERGAGRESGSSEEGSGRAIGSGKEVRESMKDCIVWSSLGLFGDGWIERMPTIMIGTILPSGEGDEGSAGGSLFPKRKRRTKLMP
jgi:hypothetical protein